MDQNSKGGGCEPGEEMRRKRAHVVFDETPRREDERLVAQRGEEEEAPSGLEEGVAAFWNGARA